jgi:hypothetical protein
MDKYNIIEMIGYIDEIFQYLLLLNDKDIADKISSFISKLKVESFCPYTYLYKRVS